MNQYPLWKNALVIIVILLGTLFALPNFYGEDPALIISKESGLVFNETESQTNSNSEPKESSPEDIKQNTVSEAE